MYVCMYVCTLHWWPLAFLILSPPLQNFQVVPLTKKCLLCFLYLALNPCPSFSRWASLVCSAKTPIKKPPLIRDRGHLLVTLMKVFYRFWPLLSRHPILNNHGSGFVFDKAMAVRSRGTKWQLINAFKHMFIVLFAWNLTCLLTN